MLAGSVRHEGTALLFRVRDPKLKVSVPVRYTGIVPDPFADGRGVLVTVREQGSQWIGEQNSLTTKCPSKYQAASSSMTDGDMALTGRALLILGLAVAVYGAAPRCTARGPDAASGSTPAGARCTRSPG